MAGATAAGDATGSDATPDAERPASVATTERTTSPRKGGRRPLRGQQLWRRLHAWTSLTSLVVMVFFGLTGILLNHTGWTFGSHATTSTITGTLPSSVKVNGNVDLLAVSEWIRSTDHITADINGHGTSGTSAFINYLGPGYQANLSFDTSKLTYTLTQNRTGWVGVLEDVHRSKGTGIVWSIVNDLSGVLLVLIGVTGLLITWLTRARHRTRDLLLAALGLVIAVVTIVIATH